MIETTIRVQGKNDYEFEGNMRAALAHLGYQPKPSEDHVRYEQDVFAALREKGIDVYKLVEEYRGINMVPPL